MGRSIVVRALFVVAAGCGAPESHDDPSTTLPTTGITDPSAGDPTGAVDASTSGSTTAPIDESSSGAGSTTDAPKFDLAAIPDTEPMECIQCALTIASMQSGVFEVQGANIFGTALLTDQVVYALGTAGVGRFIATADSSLPFNEVSDCPIVPWLSGTEAATPSFLWFGWTPSDGPMQWAQPGDASGVHMPPQYVGNPAQLAADYDMVMYLEGSGQFDMGDEPTDEEMQTLVDYVTTYGGGLYISSEFADPAGGAYLNAADLVSINRALVPLGLTALQVSLNWGNVDGNIDFECFPTPAG